MSGYILRFGINGGRISVGGWGGVGWVVGEYVVKSPIDGGINGSKTLTLTLPVNYGRNF